MNAFFSWLNTNMTILNGRLLIGVILFFLSGLCFGLAIGFWK